MINYIKKKLIPRNSALMIFGFARFPFKINRLLFGDEAYAHHQLAAYGKHIVRIREEKQANFDEKEKLLFELIEASGFTNIVELGSTLGVLLDKFDLYNPRKSAHLAYTGIEPLSLLANFSKYLHENRLFKVVENHRDVPDHVKEVGFGSMSHTYAFQSTEELIEYIDSFRISVDRIYFSLTNRHTNSLSFGNSSASAFDFEKFLENILKKKKIFLLEHALRHDPKGLDVQEVTLICIDSDLTHLIEKMGKRENLVLLPERISINRLNKYKSESIARGSSSINIIKNIIESLKLMAKINLTP